MRKGQRGRASSSSWLVDGLCFNTCFGACVIISGIQPDAWDCDVQLTKSKSSNRLPRPMSFRSCSPRGMSGTDIRNTQYIRPDKHEAPCRAEGSTHSRRHQDRLGKTERACVCVCVCVCMRVCDAGGGGGGG